MSNDISTSGSTKKLAIVTGGNIGLGFECAKKLASSLDWHVIIACRTPKTAAEAVKTIQETSRASHNPDVSYMDLDLSSLQSVRDFEAQFARQKSSLPPLKALICNAGIQIISQYTTTKEGFETTFGVNHLGHFLLANLMLKHLDQQDSRIVFVASGTHDPAQKTGMPDPEYTSARELAFLKPDPSTTDITTFGRKAYTTSKLCNVFCAYEMARRLRAVNKDQNITVAAFDPGLMPGTGLARDYNVVLRFVWNWILPAVAKLHLMHNVNTVADSGAALARLATDPSLTGVTSKYYEGLREIRSSVGSYDEDKARDLWNTSIELVKLTPTEAYFR